MVAFFIKLSLLLISQNKKKMPNSGSRFVPSTKKVILEFQQASRNINCVYLINSIKQFIVILYVFGISFRIKEFDF